MQGKPKHAKGIKAKMIHLSNVMKEVRQYLPLSEDFKGERHLEPWHISHATAELSFSNVHKTQCQVVLSVGEGTDNDFHSPFITDCNEKTHFNFIWSCLRMRKMHL